MKLSHFIWSVCSIANVFLALASIALAQGDTFQPCCQSPSDRCSGCQSVGTGYANLAGSAYDCSPGHPADPPCDDKTSRVCYGPVPLVTLFEKPDCTVQVGFATNFTAKMPTCVLDACD